MCGNSRVALAALLMATSIRWPAVAQATELEGAHVTARARVTATHRDQTAKGPIRPWLETVSPRLRWDWRHLEHIQGALDRVTAGKTKRLMLFLPPRHGKSELATVRYPVYRLERDPETKVIIGAYNATLARKFSRKARRIARERLSLSDDRTAVEDWETTRGGGVRAVGVGDGVTGQGGNLIIIDHGYATTIYGHLGDNRQVGVGARVQKGQHIGYVGAQGPHARLTYLCPACQPLRGGANS